MEMQSVTLTQPEVHWNPRSPPKLDSAHLLAVTRDLLNLLNLLSWGPPMVTSSSHGRHFGSAWATPCLPQKHSKPYKPRKLLLGVEGLEGLGNNLTKPSLNPKTCKP